MIDFCNSVAQSIEILDGKEIKEYKEKIVEKFDLHENPINYQVLYADFSGDGNDDVLVYYELEGQSNILKNQYLNIYLWDDDNQKYKRVRSDEGTILTDNVMSGEYRYYPRIEEFKIIDFNSDGKNEIFVSKNFHRVLDHRYYVMGYSEGEMLDIQSERISNKNWLDYYKPNLFLFYFLDIEIDGTQRVSIKDNKILRTINLHGDCYQCHEAPTIEVELKLEGDEFVINNQKIILGRLHMVYYFIKLPVGWVEFEKNHFKDHNNNYFKMRVEGVGESDFDVDDLYQYQHPSGRKILVTKNVSQRQATNFPNSKTNSFIAAITNIEDDIEKYFSTFLFWNEDGETTDPDFIKEILSGFNFNR